MPGPETLQPQQHGPSMSYSSSSTTHRQHQGVLDGLNNLAEALSPRGHEEPGYVYVAGLSFPKLIPSKAYDAAFRRACRRMVNSSSGNSPPVRPSAGREPGS